MFATMFVGQQSVECEPCLIPMVGDTGMTEPETYVYRIVQSMF